MNRRVEGNHLPIWSGQFGSSAFCFCLECYLCVTFGRERLDREICPGEQAVKLNVSESTIITMPHKCVMAMKLLKWGITSICFCTETILECIPQATVVSFHFRMDSWFATRIIPPFSAPPLTLESHNWEESALETWAIWCLRSVYDWMSRVSRTEGNLIRFLHLLWRYSLCFCVDGHNVRNGIQIKLPHFFFMVEDYKTFKIDFFFSNHKFAHLV